MTRLLRTRVSWSRTPATRLVPRVLSLRIAGTRYETRVLGSRTARTSHETRVLGSRTARTSHEHPGPHLEDRSGQARDPGLVLEDRGPEARPASLHGGTGVPRGGSRARMRAVRSVCASGPPAMGLGLTATACGQSTSGSPVLEADAGLPFDGDARDARCSFRKTRAAAAMRSTSRTGSRACTPRRPTTPSSSAMNARGQRQETGGKLGTFCVNCHAPLAVRDGLTKDGLNLASLDAKYRGVTCFFCHSIDSVDGGSNAAVGTATDLGDARRDPRPGAEHRRTGRRTRRFLDKDSPAERRGLRRVPRHRGATPWTSTRSATRATTARPSSGRSPSGRPRGSATARSRSPARRAAATWCRAPRCSRSHETTGYQTV